MILRVFWNGHLGRTGILPVSIDFRAGRMPTLLLFIGRFSNAVCPVKSFASKGDGGVGIVAVALLSANIEVK